MTDGPNWYLKVQLKDDDTIDQVTFAVDMYDHDNITDEYQAMRRLAAVVSWWLDTKPELDRDTGIL